MFCIQEHYVPRFEAFFGQNMIFYVFQNSAKNLNFFLKNFQKKFERKIAGEVIKHILNKFENAGGTCAGAVGCLAHAGGEFATAPTAPLSKP